MHLGLGGLYLDDLALLLGRLATRTYVVQTSDLQFRITGRGGGKIRRDATGLNPVVP
jgi:hypothetical protein